MFLEILFVSSFASGSARFSKFDCQNVVLFQIKENTDLVTFIEVILNGKLHFLCNVRC